MIVAIGSLQRAAIGIIRSGDYSPIEAPEDFVAYKPQSDNLPIVVLGGSGTERAARATQWAIEEFNPDAVISFGFCGATKDHALSGDIVIAARVMDLPGTPFEWSIVDETNSQNSYGRYDPVAKQTLCRHKRRRTTCDAPSTESMDRQDVLEIGKATSESQFVSNHRKLCIA